MRTIDRIRKHPLLEHLDLMTLRSNRLPQQGMELRPFRDNRGRGEDTASELLRAIRQAQPFVGTFTE